MRQLYSSRTVKLTLLLRVINCRQWKVKIKTTRFLLMLLKTISIGEIHGTSKYFGMVKYNYNHIKTVQVYSQKIYKLKHILFFPMAYFPQSLLTLCKHYLLGKYAIWHMHYLLVKYAIWYQFHAASSLRNHIFANHMNQFKSSLIGSNEQLVKYIKIQYERIETTSIEYKSTKYLA